MVSASRIDRIGETPHAHEREGLRFLEGVLPNTDPFHVWELFEFIDPSTGRLLEVDALVMGYSALYLLELKGGPGKYEGDSVDWYRTPPGEGRRYMDAPLRGANFKAKLLKSRLESRFHARPGKNSRLPRVEALVFLSHDDVTLAFTHGGDVGVVTQKTLKQALQFNQYPGASNVRHGDPISAPVAHEIARILRDEIGIRPRKGKMLVGDWELRQLLVEGDAYQDRVACHTSLPNQQRRARTYLVPLQTSVELRQQMRRAADREAQLLFDVREHPNVMRIEDYQTESPIGPTVFFEHFDGVTLDVFMRQNPQLEFGKRIEIIEQVGQALVYCHRKQIVHGALSPESVLVRQDDTGRIHTRLFNFQAGRGGNVSSTRHLTAFTTSTSQVYQAPEVIEDPNQRSESSDFFSLGALGYFLLTGQPPAKTVAELYERLKTADGLDPLTVDNNIPTDVAELIGLATKRSKIYRGGDVDDLQSWIDLLVEKATAPSDSAPAVPDKSPLEARKDDLLAGGTLRVNGILGQGASSRVLHVTRLSDEREYALKCSLSEDHDRRLRAEAEVLEDIGHPRIVQLVGKLTLADRQCLLMSLAGERTLHRELISNGVVSLDYAARYGEDLLLALARLEEKGVIHRDIKPANLGVGAPTKQRMHLTLFDFSLATAALTDLDVGTSAYRDPFLRSRGSWDMSADRFSAAMTLHEMLTGLRPSLPPGMAALDPDAVVAIAAERFDASVRTKLTAFFTRAFARDAAARHETAVKMCHAWIACFEAEPVAVVGPEKGGAPAGVTGDGESKSAPHRPAAWDPAALTDEQLRAITPDQSIESLPLSLQAKNALDRAGVLRMVQLLDLPENQLSAVRGVGRALAKKVLQFRARWIAATQMVHGDGEVFFPNYRGEDRPLSAVTLDKNWVTVLSDAGLGSLGRIAQAPLRWMESLASRHTLQLAPLRAVLDKEQQRAAQRAEPTQIEDFLEALLPTKKNREILELLYGLREPLAGRLNVTARDVATHLGITRPRIYQVLAACRDTWVEQPALAVPRDAAHTSLDAAGGALPLPRAADSVLERIAHDVTAPEALRRARAAALLRIVAEVEREDPAGMRIEILSNDEAWLLTPDCDARTLETLGRAATQLAERDPLASPGEVQRSLGEKVAGTPLERLTPDRLVQTAAWAGKNVECSPRLELYPRGMSAKRALDLSSAILTTPLDALTLRQRVQARYPGAEPLPEGAALQELLATHGLHWNPEQSRFERPGDRSQTSLHTSFLGVGTQLQSATTSQPRSMDPPAIHARELDDQLNHAIDRSLLRVLGVSPALSHDVTQALVKRKALTLVNLDAELLREMKSLMAKACVNANAVHETDRFGEASPQWSLLKRLAEDAANAIAQRLLPGKNGPLLVIRLGLVARYRLEDFLKALVSSAKDPKSKAIFLLVPAHEGPGVPAINGELAIPGVLSPQALWLTEAWLKNLHNAAA